MATPQRPNTPVRGFFSPDYEYHTKIANYTALLNLPQGLADSAQSIYSQTYNHTIRQTQGIRALAAACIFAACRESRVQITLVKAVSTTGASMRHTLLALWHVERSLDNVSLVLRMEVTSTPSDGPCAISINGKPKKMYTLTWPVAQDFNFDPNWHSGCCKLWEMYKRRLNSNQTPSTVSDGASHKKDVSQAGFPSYGYYGEVVPAVYAQFPGACIRDDRAFSKAPTENTSHSWLEDFGPEAVPQSTDDFFNDGHASGLASAEETSLWWFKEDPASSPAVIEGAAKAWSNLTSRHKAHSNATASASAASPTEPSMTGTFISNGHASDKAPTARTSALDSAVVEGAAKAWSSLLDSHKAHSNVTASASAASPTNPGKTESAANTTSVPVQREELLLTNEGPKCVTLPPGAKKIEPVKSTLQSTHKHPAPTSTIFSTSKNPTVVDDDKPEPVKSILQSTHKHPAPTSTIFSTSTNPTVVNNKKPEPVKSVLQNTHKHPAPTNTLFSNAIFSTSKTPTAAQSNDASIAPPPSPTTTPPPPSASANKPQPSFHALAESYRARNIATQDPNTYSTKHWRKLLAGSQAQRALDIAEAAKAVQAEFDAAAKVKGVGKVLSGNVESTITTKANESSKKVEASFDAEKVKAMGNVSSGNVEATTTTKANESTWSKPIQANLDAAKIKAINTVSASTSKTASVNGDKEQEAEQVWENVDIAPIDTEDKEWDLIDEKEVTGIENREKAEAKVAAERGGWTGSIRRGLFG